MVLLVWSRQYLGEFSRTVGELAEANRQVAEVCLLLGIEASKPVRGNSSIQFHEVNHCRRNLDHRIVREYKIIKSGEKRPPKYCNTIPVGQNGILENFEWRK